MALEMMLPTICSIESRSHRPRSVSGAVSLQVASALTLARRSGVFTHRERPESA
jgi:hypothetical protein